jgi:hypothetical protein
MPVTNDDNDEVRALVRHYLMVGYPRPMSLTWLHTELKKNLENFLISMDDIYQEGTRFQLTPDAYQRYARNYEANSRRLSCTQ